jgi:four helix bundle protein
MGVKQFNDLIVWQKAMDFAETLYRATAKFPKEEVYGLTSQIRRAAVSIPSNIAEGQCRGATNDCLRFLSIIVLASGAELETQLHLARRFNYLNDATTQSLIDSLAEVSRLLRGLHRSLVQKRSSSD